MRDDAGFSWRGAALRVACLLAIPLLGWGAWLSLRLARADERFRENTPESVAEAAAIEPGNAAYRDLLAEHLEGVGRNPDAEWEAAVRLSPRESHHSIGLAIRAEVENDYPRSEKLLLRAAEVNAGFEPRWALMNFYFRRGDTAKFENWARKTLEIAEGDLGPVLRLCFLAIADERRIEALLPPREATRIHYLEYLVGAKQVKTVPAVAEAVANNAGEADVPLLLNYCEAMLPAHPDAAEGIWNILCRRKLQPFEELKPETGHIITNGDFRAPPTGRGFDWQIPAVDGAFLTSAPGEGLSVEMTGNEPEECELLLQAVPLAPGRKYRLRYEYKGPAEPDSGLSWYVRVPESAGAVGHSANLTLTGDWTTGEVTFDAGEAQGAILSLLYKRPLGKIRRKGNLALRKVAAGLAP